MVTHYKNSGPKVDPSTIKFDLPPIGGPQPGLPNFGSPPPGLGGKPGEQPQQQPSPPAIDLSQPPKFN
jgi:hypothetical protein